MIPNREKTEVEKNSVPSSDVTPKQKQPDISVFESSNSSVVEEKTENYTEQESSSSTQDITSRGEVDSFGLDAIRELAKGNTRTRPEVQVGFYTLEGAKLMVNNERERAGDKRNAFQMGLEGFDNKLYLLMSAAKDDNPFADSLLLQIEEISQHLKESSAEQKLELERMITRQLRDNNASMLVTKNDFITTVSPKFRHQFTYSIMWTAVQIDQLLKTVSLAQSLAIINAKVARSYTTSAIKKFRNLMNMASRYKPNAVTRKDLALRTANGIKSLQELATNEKNNIILRPDVLRGRKRSTYAPHITGRKSAVLPEYKDEIEQIAQLIEAGLEEQNKQSA